MWSEARSALERHFGYRDFRPGQRAAIRSILEGRDTLIVMPTGGGKSLCYQVPALVLPGLTLVVSPLIALMLDQVSALQARGIAAELINSTISAVEIEERLRRAVGGELKLLYVAPERFASRTFQRALDVMRVDLVAIDEAHCVCEWGHDFRPSYLRLRSFWQRLGQPRLLALTATATPEIRDEISVELGLRKPRVIIRGFDRPNLRLRVQREEKLALKCRALVSLLGEGADTAIVYASTRKMVEAVTDLLRTSGLSAAAYHAGLPRDERVRVQEVWTTGAVPVVVSTNAFGMGIDKEDVRRVIHFQIPGSLEAYYQEAGRAGRDGQPAECVLLHSYRDRFVHEFFVHAAYPPRKLISAVYQALRDAVRDSGCPILPARLAARVRGARSEREIHSALRILRDAGVVEDTASRAGCLVRWIVGPTQLRALATGEDGVGDLPCEVLDLLAGLARASAGGEQRLLRLSRWEIARWVDGDFSRAREGLDLLQRVGVLGWRDDGLRPGYRPVTPQTAGKEAEVDWEGVARRRELELRKLKRMEKYAFQQGCRRRYLLRYFGERHGPYRCGNCDRCL